MEYSGLKKAAYISLGALVLLMVGAVVFYKERMLLCDDAHIAFHIINEGRLQVQQLRIGAFITQSVPLLLAKLHLPLKAVLIGYSLSFNLFYLIVAAILVFRFRAYGLAILMAFYYTLIASDGYYWTNNEIHQGMAWMFLCFGYIFSPGKSRHFIGVLLCFLLVGGLAVITHPLVIVPFIFLLGFYGLKKDEWKFTKHQTIIIAFVGIILVAARIVISRQGAEYDRQMLNNITAPTLAMATDLLKNMVKNYWLLPVLFIVGLAGAIRQKKLLMAAWSGIFCIAYFIMVCMTFRGYLAFYTESELMPVIIPATALFVFLWLPGMKQQHTVWLLCGIFLIRLSYIGFASAKFTARVNAISNVLTKMKQDNISKLVLIKNDEHADPLWMLEWGLPAETFLSSALNGDTVQKQFLIVQKKDVEEKVPVPNSEIIMTGHYIQASSLNTYYFRADTSQPYFTKPYNEYFR